MFAPHIDERLGEPAIPALFTRMSIPLIRRVYPQLSIAAVLSTASLISERFIDKPREKVNWKKEGF